MNGSGPEVRVKKFFATSIDYFAGGPRSLLGGGAKSCKANPGLDRSIPIRSFVRRPNSELCSPLCMSYVLCLNVRLYEEG